MSDIKQVKARCIIHEYYDTVLDKYIKKGEVITVDLERFNYLIYKGIIEPVKEETKESDKAATKDKQ